MGNRATVVFATEQGSPHGGWGALSPAVYLHWNGGPESIYLFLDELERRGAAAGGTDGQAARFCQVVGDFFDNAHYGGLSLYIQNGPADLSIQEMGRLNPGDNGVFVCAHKRGGAGWLVRRWSGRSSREMPQREVLAEEREARQHKYAQEGFNFGPWPKDHPTEGEYMSRSRG